MQIVIQLSTSKMAHMTNQQIGAFVAHCYTLKDICFVKVWKADYADGQPYAEIAFNLPSTAALVDSAKISGQLNDALSAFADMEPFPCPCGCGAFISVSPCLRQSGDLAEAVFNSSELSMMAKGEKIGCIKSFRERMGKCRKSDIDGSPTLMTLRECVDLYNKTAETMGYTPTTK